MAKRTGQDTGKDTATGAEAGSFAGASARRLLPTTRSQVSGHRFMRRRVEHGLIYGDIRMIHDPLAARRRSAIFGVVAVALIAAGSGLFAWLRPNPDPGQAAILRASDGAMYVRVGETVHPVTNLTSARLIAGAADDPERVGDERLTDMGRGVPLGITSAPAMFAPGDTEIDVAWSACQDQGGRVTVSAGEHPAEFGENRAVVAAVGDEEWLLTRDGRAKLPHADDPQGRVVRRGIALTPKTPRLAVDAAVLSAFRELPPVKLPDPLPPVLVAKDSEDSDDAWVLTPHGGIQPVSALQKQLLIDAGATARTIPRSQIAEYPDANEPLEIGVPEQAPEWIDPETVAVCATEAGVPATSSSDALVKGAIELSGSSPATHFKGLEDGAVGVDTGASYHVVSASGQRHVVEGKESLDVVGAQHVEEVPWSLLRLLPEGPELTREAALTATY